MRRRKHIADALHAAELESQESCERAKADAAVARQAKRTGQDLAAKIQAYNEANGFAAWIFDDLAGGPA